MNGESVHMGDLLSAYADGELTEAERATVDAHLGTCPACGQELEATRRAKAWVADLPAVDCAVRLLRAHAARSQRAPAGVVIVGSSGPGPSAWPPRPPSGSRWLVSRA